MKSRKTTFAIAILIAIIHCVLGNLIGASYNISSNFLEFIFLPYSFIGGLSNFAGWDTLSIVLELIGLVVMTFIFYGVLSLIRSLRTKNT
jgi:hypothetical protein